MFLRSCKRTNIFYTCYRSFMVLWNGTQVFGRCLFNVQVQWTVNSNSLWRVWCSTCKILTEHLHKYQMLWNCTNKQENPFVLKSPLLSNNTPLTRVIDDWLRYNTDEILCIVILNQCLLFRDFILVNYSKDNAK